MPVRVQRFPEFGVTVGHYSGALTIEALMQAVDRLEPADATGCWINYLHASLDLSGVDVAHFPMVRQAIAAKLRALQGEARPRSAWVSAAPAANDLLEFWPSYVGGDSDYPSDVAAFPTLEAACAWLGLSEPARGAVIEAIEDFDRSTAGRSRGAGDAPVGSG